MWPQWYSDGLGSLSEGWEYGSEVVPLLESPSECLGVLKLQKLPSPTYSHVPPSKHLRRVSTLLHDTPIEP